MVECRRARLSASESATRTGLPRNNTITKEWVKSLARLWVMEEFDIQNISLDDLKGYINHPLMIVVVTMLVDSEDPTAVCMGQAIMQYTQAVEQRKALEGALGKDKISEHRELLAAMDTMIEVSDVSLGSALAVYQQMQWIITDCKCQGCMMRRQRANATQS